MMRTSFIRFFRRASGLLIPVVLLVSSLPSHAQNIVRLRPDRAAPGMNVIVEVIAKTTSLGLLGNPGLDSKATRCYPLNPSDSTRIVIGPVQVSWGDRLMQVPIFVAPNADTGDIPIVLSTSSPFDTIVFTIAKPNHLPPLSGNVVLGIGLNGKLSKGNTLLIDGMSANNATITVSLQDPDTNTPGNPRLEPLTILSTGQIIFANSSISVNGVGKNGGSGGGGGGSGFPGIGGVGFSGGGNCPDTSGLIPTSNVGSDSEATLTAGGRSITGVFGGGTDYSDQGGGGGTGMPFGNQFNSSGQHGIGGGGPKIGGYGGGSAGGESPSIATIEVYGGGGGGFGKPGAGGLEPAGAGQNGGNPYGGRFLIPLCGGSGGGAGNSYDLQQGAVGGSGGGGGGALALISFDSITFNNSSLTARGDSGTSGQIYAAGGGGGSGGGIWVAGARGIGGGGSSISTSGGVAGNGSLNAFAGGAGGAGRVRIDGFFNPSVLSFNIDHSGGASITPISQVLAGNTGRITGIAADTFNTLDTVRIYYRNHHTRWQYVDTVRTHGRWSKWIPLLHDSTLYVMAIAQVNQINLDQQNIEPDWIMTHVGLALVHHIPTPSLVIDTTLNFGNGRLGFCPKRWIRVSNEGEAPLTIDSLQITGVPDFTLLSGKKTIGGYSTDSIEVEFCPDSLGLRKAILTFVSNDSENLRKSIAVSGVGIRRLDSLRFFPTVLHFGRVPIDSCTSDTVTLISIGKDTLELNGTQWNVPPFSAHLLAHDSLLAPGTTARLLITFCPKDTFFARGLVPLDSRYDTLRLDGNGTVRRFAVADSVALGVFGFCNPIDFPALIRSTGNDAVTLTSVTSSAPNIHAAQSLPLVLNLNRSDTIQWRILKPGPGSHQDTLTYLSRDTVQRTIVTYRIIQPVIKVDSSVAFPFLCVSDTDTVIVRFRNPTDDTIRVSDFRHQNSSGYSLLARDTLLAPRDSAELSIVFHPQSAKHETDSLFFTATLAACDSIYGIPISGTGVVDGLAADSIDFGTVLIGDCRYDSLRIRNTCGPGETLDTVITDGDDFQIVSTFPINLPSKGSVELRFRYCPKSAGDISNTIHIVPHISLPVTTLLKGNGLSKVVPSAYFRITSSPTIAPGATARTELWLDSSTITGIHKLLSTKISFDPAVVYPNGGTPFKISTTAADTVLSEAFALDFSGSPKFVEAIDWLGLLGPRSFTTLGLSIRTDTPCELHVSQGSVSVQDCYGLNGRISVAGPYRLGEVVPDAAPGRGTVSVTLGNEGFVEATIYDVTGRRVKQVLSEYRKPGSYELSLPFSGVSSGRYFLEVSSLGWREVRPFSLDR